MEFLGTQLTISSLTEVWNIEHYIHSSGKGKQYFRFLNYFVTLFHHSPFAEYLVNC